ncbi:MAG: hypothetical protein OEY09_11600 [Gammaproteobacteria bacterium]|nr:hypothetical protein [Gammaproteobacteria bacterium]
MAEQFCPRCKEKSFVWSLDEEASQNTQWHCSSCEFYAEEDESLESLCKKCNTENLLYLKIDNEFLRFCTNCQFQEKAKPW